MSVGRSFFGFSKDKTDDNPQEVNVAEEIPQGYREVPEEDRKKAAAFFERGKTVAGTGNFDYAIEMYVMGLALDPDAMEAHQELRDISLKRKASGGKTLGMFERMKLKPTKDDKQNMINAEKLLSYDPGNTDYMIQILQNAHRAGYFDTVLWIGPILQKANADSGKPDIHKFLTLKDTYAALGRWKLASDAAHFALRMRPEDMDLQADTKNFAARETMEAGKYGKAGSFRESVRDLNKQYRLMDSDKNVNASDIQSRIILEAEEEYAAEPGDVGKLARLVDALDKTDDPKHEARAIELLQGFFEKTKQFRFRQRLGRIQMKQMARGEKAKRAAYAADPADPELKREWTEYRKEQLQFELSEYSAWSEAYPTDLTFKYEMGRRMFELEMYNEAIPVLQQARSDPKQRIEAGVMLARSFLNSGFLDEADETLGAMIKDYQAKGDARAKELYYWRGIVLELKKENAEAIKHFSQVAQWDFNYRDVQARIKRLRGL